MNIEKLLADIIPPDDYQHRNGFSNTHIIDKLNDKERLLIENALINKLLDKTDLLVVVTLAYMKSSKAIPIMMALLKQCSDSIYIITIATSIFEINHDQSMITLCTNAFSLLSDKYEKIVAFFYLRKFQNNITDAIIEEYVTHPDFLLSYNAKQALAK